MARYIRNTVILAKVETAEGTDAVPTGSANAILVSDVTITPLDASTVNRDLIRGYFGGSQQLVGTASVKVEMTVELAGSGTATTAPSWGALLQGCGFSGTAGASWYEFNPVSSFGASSSVTLYYYLDGVLHKLLGSRGSFSASLLVGERPSARFTFVGRDGGVTAATNATPTLTSWQVPLVVTDTNTGDITLGVTYASGAFSSGTAYPSKGLGFNIGNTVQYQPLLGAENVIITQRDVTGAMSLDLTAAQVASFHADVKANTTTTLGLTHGTAAGNILMVYGPVVQRVNPSVENLNGQALHAYELRFLPSSGNDELKIITK